MPPKNLHFKQHQLANDFLQNGYVLLRDFLSDEELSSLRQIIDSYSPPLTNSFFYSLMNYPLSTNQEIRAQIKQTLITAYKKLFLDYKTRNESFLIKPALLEQEMFLHQDWSYTDIRSYHTATLWIPLVETNNKNGALYFLKKSHQKFPAFVSATLPTSRIPRNLFSDNCIDNVFTKLGDAILFNPQIFHGSYANVSQQSRPVVTATIFHSEAPFLLPHKTPTSDKWLFELHDDAFLESLNQLAIGDVSHGVINRYPLNADEPATLSSVLEAYK